MKLPHRRQFASGRGRCRTPGRLLRRMLASVALRTSIGSRRRSAPFKLQQVEGVEERLRLVRPVPEQRGSRRAPARRSTPPHRRSGMTSP